MQSTWVIGPLLEFVGVVGEPEEDKTMRASVASIVSTIDGMIKSVTDNPKIGGYWEGLKTKINEKLENFLVNRAQFKCISKAGKEFLRLEMNPINCNKSKAAKSKRYKYKNLKSKNRSKILAKAKNLRKFKAKPTVTQITGCVGELAMCLTGVAVN